MIDLPHIHARIVRLHELTHGLAAEVHAWHARQAPFLPPGRFRSLDGLQDALAGLDAARVVLEGAGRLDGSRAS